MVHVELRLGHVPRGPDEPGKVADTTGTVAFAQVHTHTHTRRMGIQAATSCIGSVEELQQCTLPTF